MGDLLWINGKKYNIANCDPDTRLSDFIRDHAKLRGTKTTCKEGGCGSCVVTVTRKCKVSGTEKTTTINSCLCPIHTVTDGHVTTIEGLGNQHDGFHPLQKNIAVFNGSQCGYCTPGMVMNMYGLFCQNGKKPTNSEIEQAFDGNICRCTGYTSILDSAKDFVKDCGSQQVLDIEDLHIYKCKYLENDNHMSEQVFNGQRWYSPKNLTQLNGLLAKHSGKSVRLVFGNTAAGIQPETSFDVHISIRHVQELNLFKVHETEVEIGANTTIQEMIDWFGSPEYLTNNHTDAMDGFGYLKHALVPHLQKLGNLAIRNAGSCAGNLMVKHRDNMFPSDLFTPMEALQAKIKIGHNGIITTCTPAEFMDLDMENKVIISLTFPAIDPQTEKFQSFKVMPTAANAYAYVNASFHVQLNNTGSETKVVQARLAYGGISSSCHRAIKTEACLQNRTLDKGILTGVYECLEEELQCEEKLLLPSGQYRRGVARNLLHQFLTNACSPKVSVEQFYENTGRKEWTSSATYDFETKEDQYPYGQPSPKLDSCLQASGEAEFIGDKPKCDNELHAACVLSEYAKADVAKIDTTQAENMPGVCKVITAKNMSGIQNNFPFRNVTEKAVFLVEDHTDFAGQLIAIVLADSEQIARMAAKLVQVEYTNMQKPILTIEEAIGTESFHINCPPDVTLKVNQGDAETAYTKSEHQLTGEVNLDTQYHFYMENQIAYCIPYDDMLDVWLSSQTLTMCQRAISDLLQIPLASINMKALRLGGGFGGKNANCAYLGSICALAAKMVKRPVRFALSLSDCMKMTGKRFPATAKYKVGVSSDGNIEAILMDFYYDAGYIASAYTYFMSNRALTIMDNGYRIPHWKVSGHVVKTNRFPTTSMRAPDGTPTVFIMESIMDHVASELNIDPIILKEKHLLREGDPSLKGCPYIEVPLSQMWSTLKCNMDLEKRQSEINIFNKANRFKKRGLSMVPSKLFITYSKMHAYNAYVTVYSGDGTIAITHGAIEMGQGLNTKVVQVAASILGVDTNIIKVHTTASLTAADSAGTYGSLGSECVCRSVMECCNELKQRMHPVRELHPEATWRDLVFMCFEAGIDMAVSYKFTSYENPHGPFAYCMFGVCAFEAEIDVLTGENVITAVDAIFDIGESANPTIDIGQIEGALVMGLGYFRTEKEIHHPETGALLTDGTWEYKVPTAKDIPLKMNVKLLKNKKNHLGVMPSKAIGEPAILSSAGVVFAIKQAVASFRKESGDTAYFSAKQPMTVDTVQEMCKVKQEDLLKHL